MRLRISISMKSQRDSRLRKMELPMFLKIPYLRTNKLKKLSMSLETSTKKSMKKLVS